MNVAIKRDSAEFSVKRNFMRLKKFKGNREEIAGEFVANGGY
jgi:hypothetical protein